MHKWAERIEALKEEAKMVNVDVIIRYIRILRHYQDNQIFVANVF